MRAMDYISIVIILIATIIISTTSGSMLLGEGSQTIFNGKQLAYQSYTNGTLANENITFAHYGETYSEKFEPYEAISVQNRVYVIADHSIKGQFGESENVFISDDYEEGDIGENISYDVAWESSTVIDSIDVNFVEELNGKRVYQVYEVNGEYYAIPENGQATVELIDGDTILIQSVEGKIRVGAGSKLVFDGDRLIGPTITILGLFAIGYIFVWKRQQ